MHKSWLVGLALAVAAGACGMTFAGERERPSAKVQKLIHKLEHRNPSVREEAVEALRDLGPKAAAAIPALIRRFDDRNGEVREGAVEALVEMGPIARVAHPALLTAIRKHPRGEFRALAVRGVVAISQSWVTPHGEIVPGQTTDNDCLLSVEPWVLAGILHAVTDRHYRVRESAAWALGNIGPHTEAVLPALVGLLNDRSRSVRVEAAGSLRNWGSLARPAVPALTKRLQDRSPRVRVEAARALWPIDGQAEKVVPVLAAELRFKKRKLGAAEEFLREAGDFCIPTSNDPAAESSEPVLVIHLDESTITNNDFRCWAMRYLAEMGPAAKAAVPALEALLTEEFATVRVEAARTLWEIGYPADKLLPILVSALETRDYSILTTALDVLEEMGPVARKAVPALNAFLERRVRLENRRKPEEGPAAVSELPFAFGVSVWGRAINVLCKIGPAARPALPVLTDLLEDKDPEIRCKAARALCRIDGQAHKIVPYLVRMLQEPDGQARGTALGELKALGPDACDAIPILRSWLQGKDPCARLEAAMALWKIQAGNPETVPVLIEGLQEPEHGETALYYLAEIGPAARAAVPRLKAILQAEKWGYLRTQAAVALGKICPQDREGLSFLVSSFQDHDMMTRLFAVAAVGDLGPAAKPAVPALVSLLKESNPFTREIAAEALKAIDPKAAARAGIPVDNPAVPVNDIR